MATTFLDGRVTLHAGDCIEALAAMPDASVDSVVCDPPYHLTTGKKGGSGMASLNENSPAGRARISTGGFMGKAWDGGDVAFQVATWEAVLRVLKPGGHLVAFSGTRTYHRMVCAIEDAGFEIRDQIAWCFGSGFPKSHDVSKGIDKARRRDYVQAAIDLGVALPGRSVDDWTKEDHAPGDKWWAVFRAGLPAATWAAIERKAIGVAVSGRSAWFVNGEGDITAPATEAAKQWEGWGTALKPAWEPIVLARKPLIGTVAQNVVEHGTGALNIAECRVSGAKPDTTRGAGGQHGRYSELEAQGRILDDGLGRWPANIVHDGSEEVLAAFPLAGGQKGGASSGKPSSLVDNVYGDRKRVPFPLVRDDDWGSAARFFYTAKADADDRLGSKHPTVKPLDLMQWLVRLVTPKGGAVLDPFAGTGTTGEAAWREGMNAILIEREEEYQADIARRMALVENPTKRAAIAKSKNNLDKPEDLPLFAASFMG